MLSHPLIRRPLVLVRTWSGSYERLSLLHRILLGWARYWWDVWRGRV